MTHTEDKKTKKKVSNKKSKPDTIYEEEMKKHRPKGAIE